MKTDKIQFSVFGMVKSIRVKKALACVHQKNMPEMQSPHNQETNRSTETEKLYLYEESEII